MRLLPAVVLVTACSAQPEDQTTNGAAAPAPGQPDRRIECRIDGAVEFQRICSQEWVTGPDGQILILRKPDGGFRRLRATNDIRYFVAADGAEQANAIALRHGVIQITIGGDQFRLP